MTGNNRLSLSAIQGVLPDSQIASSIARDSELSSAISNVGISISGTTLTLNRDGTGSNSISIPSAGGGGVNYSAGNGLSLSNNTFSVSNPFTNADEAKLDSLATITSVSTGLSLSNGVLTNTVVNTDTTYSAGSGLSITGTTFSVTNPFTNADETKLDGLANIRSIGTGLNLSSTGSLTATAASSGGGSSYTITQLLPTATTRLTGPLIFNGHYTNVFFQYTDLVAALPDSQEEGDIAWGWVGLWRGANFRRGSTNTNVNRSPEYNWLGERATLRNNGQLHYVLLAFRYQQGQWYQQPTGISNAENQQRRRPAYYTRRHSGLLRC